MIFPGGIVADKEIVLVQQLGERWMEGRETSGEYFSKIRRAAAAPSKTLLSRIAGKVAGLFTSPQTK
jgi:hypothetical protein